jgi:hypothetical protein
VTKEKKLLKLKRCLLEIFLQDVPNNIDAVKIFLDKATGLSNSQEQIVTFIAELKNEGYIEEKDGKIIVTEKGNKLLNTSGIEQGEQDTQGEQGNNNIIKIKAGGSVGADFVIEPIGDGRYIYNINGKRGTAQSERSKDKFWFFEIDKKTYVFEEPPIKKPLFLVPDAQSINNYINGKYKVKSGSQLFNELVEWFKLLYDVVLKYYSIFALGVLQSWLTPILNVVFYVGLEAKRGSGKTSILEGFSIVSRHGFLVGNPTEAIARDIDLQQLSVFADEIDNRTKGKDNPLYQCFRHGYRRGNIYLRHKEKTFEPEKYDPFGFKGFSIHSDVETALKHRTIMVPTKVSLDKRLPVLNLFKEELGRNILNDLFFFCIENGFKLFTSFHSFTLFFNSEREDMPIDKKRDLIFREITKNYSEAEITLLSDFIGRNAEIMFIALNVCKAFDINMNETLKEIIEEKQSYDDVPDAYLIDLLKETLTVICIENKDEPSWRMGKGDFMGNFFYPKSDVFERFREKLNSKGITRFSSSTFTEYLRELNFEDKVNVKMERIDSSDSKKKCLIFESSVLKTLGLEEKAEQTKLPLSEKKETNGTTAQDESTKKKTKKKSEKSSVVTETEEEIKNWGDV